MLGSSTALSSGLLDVLEVRESADFEEFPILIAYLIASFLYFGCRANMLDLRSANFFALCFHFLIIDGACIRKFNIP